MLQGIKAHGSYPTDETLPRMERVLKLGILRRGIPHALYVDNGLVYSSTQFGAACATLGIRRIQGRPYAPEGRGKQECFFETVRLRFLPEVAASGITTLPALNDSFWAWLDCIYHQTEHAETHQTPLARYTAGLDQVRPADPDLLHRAFLWREKRKVRKDATLSLQGNTYQVDPVYAGRTLELRFDPFDLSQMELYLDEHALGTATVVTQTRQRHLALARAATDPPTASPATPPALDFLAALRAEHQAQQARELGRLAFADLAPSIPPEA